jgi:hypothetical protein
LDTAHIRDIYIYIYPTYIHRYSYINKLPGLEVAQAHNAPYAEVPHHICDIYIYIYIHTYICDIYTHTYTHTYIL